MNYFVADWYFVAVKGLFAVRNHFKHKLKIRTLPIFERLCIGSFYTDESDFVAFITL
jgi:hypothetical protein